MKKLTTLLIVWSLSVVSLLAQTELNVPATVAGSTGSVLFAPPGSTEFRPISQEIPIPPGSTIRTGSAGQVTLVPFSGVALTLSPNTELQTATMNMAAQNNRIAKKTGLMDLKKGMVTVVIDHAAAQRIPVDFKVKTPTSVAAAVGTKYAVAMINGVSYVKVIEGTVNFGPTGGAVTPITSTSGVARVNADGSVQFVSDADLPADVLLALNSAPFQETTLIAGVPDVVNLTPSQLTLLGTPENPKLGIQGETSNTQ